MFRKRREKMVEEHSDFLMRTDEDYPAEVYEQTLKEPGVIESVEHWIAQFAPAVHHFSAQGKSDDEIAEALSKTLPEYIPGMNPQLYPYLAAHIVVAVKTDSHGHDLGTSS